MRAFAIEFPRRPLPGAAPSPRNRAPRDADVELEPPALWPSGTVVEGLTDRGAAEGETAAPRPTVSDVMTRELVCVAEDATVDSVRELLLRHGISGVPVVDARGRPVGVVSKTDLLREAGSEGGRRNADGPRTAGDIMTCLAFAVPRGASIAQAAALMAYEGVHRVFVLEGDGRLAGVVTALDVARWVGEQAGYLFLSRSRRPSPA